MLMELKIRKRLIMTGLPELPDTISSQPTNRNKHIQCTDIPPPEMQIKLQDAAGTVEGLGIPGILCKVISSPGVRTIMM